MTLKKYTYKGKNMTLVIMLKIRRVATIIAETLNISFDEALEKLYKSETYKAIQNTETTYLYENSAFIVDDLLREWEYNVK